MPGVNKAELIEGIVYMPSPVRSDDHGQPHAFMNGWFCYYLSKTPGLKGLADNSTVRLDMDNEPQPDIYLNLPPHAGGTARLDADGYLAGAPTLVCEITASSVSLDLHRKLDVYRRNMVREYVVWRTEDRAVDWFIWQDEQYVRLSSDSGIIRSVNFPGLWLNVPALIDLDLPRLFATLDQGTATSEHAAFIERLMKA